MVLKIERGTPATIRTLATIKYVTTPGMTLEELKKYILTMRTHSEVSSDEAALLMAQEIIEDAGH